MFLENYQLTVLINIQHSVIKLTKRIILFLNPHFKLQKYIILMYSHH